MLDKSLTAALLDVTRSLRKLVSRKSYFGYARAHLRGLQLMGALGWFFGPEDNASLGNQVWQSFLAGDPVRTIDAALLRSTANQKSKIFEEACLIWPHREEHLRAAERLVESRAWIAAIPILLAQADGISKEVLESSQFFFGGVPKRRAASKWLRKRTDPGGQLMFWAALYKDNNKWQRQIKLKLHKFLLRVRPDCEMDGPLKQFAGHTRHAILHGEALDYGTERTTMQAVSLLGYCVTLKTLAE